MSHTEFQVTLESRGAEGYAQRVTFDGVDAPPIVMDEPAPLGAGSGPNPARMLGAAVGGCLSASLLFCLRKGKVTVDGLTTSVHGTLERNEKGRLRVTKLDVVLEPVVPDEEHDRVPRCLALFEDYCIVTASIRSAIAVSVRVEVQSSVVAEVVKA
jgi:organic hydroperoxide reductase OsmC/OhrA